MSVDFLRNVRQNMVMRNNTRRSRGVWFSVVALAAVSFAIVPTFVFADCINPTSGWEVGQCNAGSAGTPQGSIIGIIQVTMNWLLAILGFLAVISFVISGIFYFLAFGDEKKVERGKKGMVYSIIGIIVALMGLVVIQAVQTWLDATNNVF